MSNNNEWTIEMNLETGKEEVRIDQNSIRGKGKKRVSSVHREIPESGNVIDRKYRIIKFANGNCNDVLESEETVEYLLRLEGLVDKELEKDNGSKRTDDPIQKIRTVYLFRDDIIELEKKQGIIPARAKGMSPKQIKKGRKSRINAVMPVIATHNYQFLMNDYRSMDSENVRACSLEELMNGVETKDERTRHLSTDTEERPYLKVTRTLPLAQAMAIFYLTARKDREYQRFGFLHQDITPDNVSVYCKETSIQNKKGTQRSFNTKLNIVDVDMIDKAMTRLERKPLKELITGVIPVVAKEVEGYYGDEGEDSTAPFRGIESAPIEILLGNEYGNQETLAQPAHNIFQVSNLLVRMLTGYHATFLSGDSVRAEINRYELFKGRINKISDEEEKAKKEEELAKLGEKIESSIELIVENYRPFLSEEELTTLNGTQDPVNFETISNLVSDIKKRNYRAVLKEKLKDKLVADGETITEQKLAQIVDIMHKGTDEFPTRYKSYDQVIKGINALEKDKELRSYDLGERLSTIFQKDRARSVISFQEPDITKPEYGVDRTSLINVVDSTIVIPENKVLTQREYPILFNHGVSTPKDRSRLYKRGIIGTGIMSGIALLGAGVFALGSMAYNQLFPEIDPNARHKASVVSVASVPQERLIVPIGERCATSEDDVKGYSTDVVTEIEHYENNSLGEGVIVNANNELLNGKEILPSPEKTTTTLVEKVEENKIIESDDMGTIDTIPISVTMDENDSNKGIINLPENEKLEARLKVITEKGQQKLTNLDLDYHPSYDESNDPRMSNENFNDDMKDGKEKPIAVVDNNPKSPTPNNTDKKVTPDKKTPTIIPVVKECKFRASYKVGKAHVTGSIDININDLVNNCSEDEKKSVQIYSKQDIYIEYNPNSGRISITPKKGKGKPFKGTTYFEVHSDGIKMSYSVEFTNKEPKAINKEVLFEVNEDQNKLIKWNKIFVDPDSNLKYDLIEVKGGSTTSIIDVVQTARGILVKTTKADQHTEVSGNRLVRSALAQIVLRANDENTFVYNTLSLGVVPINDCPRANDQVTGVTYIPKSSKGKFRVKNLFTDPEQEDHLVITTSTPGLEIKRIGGYTNTFYVFHKGAPLKKIIPVKLEASDGIEGKCQLEGLGGDIVTSFEHLNVDADVYFHHWESFNIGQGYVLMARFIDGYLSGKKECSGYYKELELKPDVGYHLGELAKLAKEDRSIGDIFAQVAGRLVYSQSGEYKKRKSKFNLVEEHTENQNPETGELVDKSLGERSFSTREAEAFLIRGLGFGKKLAEGYRCVQVKIVHGK
jgi:hypothetical protein